jgi:N-acyl-D-aspartate/D-glutamate deacylase
VLHDADQVRAREFDNFSLKKRIFRMSAHLAMCIGFRNRGTLVEGAAADVVVYDLDRLKVLPMEVAHDFPGGEWHRGQTAEGYHTVMVNGESTFEDGRCSGATSGQLLRQGGCVSTTPLRRTRRSQCIIARGLLDSLSASSL